MWRRVKVNFRRVYEHDIKGSKWRKRESQRRSKREEWLAEKALEKPMVLMVFRLGEGSVCLKLILQSPNTPTLFNSFFFWHQHISSIFVKTTINYYWRNTQRHRKSNYWCSRDVYSNLCLFLAISWWNSREDSCWLFFEESSGGIRWGAHGNFYPELRRMLLECKDARHNGRHSHSLICTQCNPLKILLATCWLKFKRVSWRGTGQVVRLSGKICETLWEPP